VHDIVIRNEGGSIGVLYASMRDVENILSSGTDIFKSIDGGVSWTVVTNKDIRDLEISSTNEIWGGGYNNGEIYSSTDGNNWNLKYTSIEASPGRIELAVAPSNPNYVYALIGKRFAGIEKIMKSTDAGLTWVALAKPDDVNDSSIPAAYFTRSQSWYDLIAAVSPTNENEIYIGAVNTYKSIDGGTTWQKITSWESSYDNTVSAAHADQHNIVFRPNNNNEFLLANDGGIFYVPDATAIPTSGPDAYTTGVFPRNLNFNVTQFYSGAIDPVNPNGLLGGAQDNGTNYFFETGLSNTIEIAGGDGGFCFIDQTAFGAERGNYYIVSFTRNNFLLIDYSGGNTAFSYIVSNTNGGFINSADYDDVNSAWA
jgi:hypothetical protein